MITIGLTGATGAGKGIFAAFAVRCFNAVHIDTDAIARQVVAVGQPALAEIAQTFGKEVLKEDGSLDRAATAAIVFADKEKLASLNRITHRHILNEAAKRMEAAKQAGKTVCILDAPLLFESGAEKMCDVTLGIIADEAIRKERIMERDGLSEERAEERLRNAKSADYFRERCDHVIENNADLAAFEEKSRRFLKRLTDDKENDIHA